MNKYLVTLYVPFIEEQFDVFIPNSKRVVDIVYYSTKVISDLYDGEFPIQNYNLINRLNGKIYDKNTIISDTDIRNGTELIII